MVAGCILLSVMLNIDLLLPFTIITNWVTIVSEKYPSGILPLNYNRASRCDGCSRQMLPITRFLEKYPE
jgi:hypothetical protein